MRKVQLVEINQVNEIINKEDDIYKRKIEESLEINARLKHYELLKQSNNSLNLELIDLNKINEEFNDRIVELEEENKHLIISNQLLKDVLSCTEIVVNIKKEEV